RRACSKPSTRAKTRPASPCCSKTRRRSSDSSWPFSASFWGGDSRLPQLDGVASVIIGALLCAVAVLMVYESKGLLIGEGLDRQTLGELRALRAADPDVEHVQH